MTPMPTVGATIPPTNTPRGMPTIPPTNTPRVPPPTQTPMPTLPGTDEVRNLSPWEQKLLALASLRESPNSPNQWEPITYVFLNRLTDTIAPTWQGSDLRRIIADASSYWRSFVSTFYITEGHNINAETMGEPETNHIWRWTIEGKGHLGPVNHRLCPALETAQRVVQTYGTNTTFIGLYYFAHLADSEEQMKAYICLGKTTYQEIAQTRGGIRVAIVPSSENGTDLILGNLVGFPVTYNGPTDECGQL
jgi:hypothetical protein